jgi:hypothetical protein
LPETEPEAVFLNEEKIKIADKNRPIVCSDVFIVTDFKFNFIV